MSHPQKLVPVKCNFFEKMTAKISTIKVFFFNTSMYYLQVALVSYRKVWILKQKKLCEKRRALSKDQIYNKSWFKDPPKTI